MDLCISKEGTSLSLYVDGACRGNPGPAAYGFVLYSGGKRVLEGKGFLGTSTNNIAEYTALIKGLESAWMGGFVGELDIFSDSQLLVRQITGAYKVKHPELKVLFSDVQELLQRFPKTRIFHIKRGLNREADMLANKALDEALKKTGQPPAGSLREESPGPVG